LPLDAPQLANALSREAGSCSGAFSDEHLDGAEGDGVDRRSGSARVPRTYDTTRPTKRHASEAASTHRQGGVSARPRCHTSTTYCWTAGAGISSYHWFRQFRLPGRDPFRLLPFAIERD
jgi:hypothetical protein